MYIRPKYEYYHEVVKKSYVFSISGSVLDEKIIRLWIIPIRIKLWFTLRWLELKRRFA